MYSFFQGKEKTIKGINAKKGEITVGNKRVKHPLFAGRYMTIPGREEPDKTVKFSGLEIKQKHGEEYFPISKYRELKHGTVDIYISPIYM